MRHPDASLAAYVEGTATARERATAEAHLATCATCRREVKRAAAAQEMLARLPEVKAPGLDPGAIIHAATAARAARGKRSGGKTAPTLAVVPAPAEDWAPAAPTAIEGETEAAEPAAAATAVEERAAEGAPVEDDLTRRRRERDRSRAIRVVETALGAAAVLVAIVLFVGLRNQPAADRASTASAPETAASPQPGNDAGGAVRGPTDYTQITLSAHAKELVGVINGDQSLSDAQSMPAYTREAAAGKSDTAKGLACIQKGTELLENTRVYELELASYLGRPTWIGAFIVDAQTDHPVLLVLAVTVDECIPQQVIRERLAAPTAASPASP